MDSDIDLGDGDLEEENRRLRKMCRALMTRVEAGDSHAAGPYAAFHHAAALAEQVRQRTAALSEANDKLQQEIRQRQDIEQRLRQATEKAQQANQSKSRFVAAISHDLMQPLNAARLFISSLEHIEDRNATAILAKVERSLDDLEYLVTTLADATRLDAGTLTADQSAVPLQYVMDAMANEFQLLAQDKGLSFHYVPTTLWTYTDPQLLGRLLRNLLSNALRYTPKGRILLGCRRRQGAVDIVVWDTGIGFNEDGKDQLLREFSRGEQASQYHQRGLGLGLSIVDKISTLLSHPLSIRSELGRGSCFSVQVPVIAAPPQQHNQQRALADDQCHGLSVWLVDNDVAVLDSMHELLSQWGCVLTTGKDLRHIEQQHATSPAVQVLIVDYHLDDHHNGLEIAAQVTEQYGAALPVIVITADRSPEVRQHCQQHGYQLLHKPIKPLQLRMALRQRRR